MQLGRIVSITEKVRKEIIPEPIVWIPFTVINNGKPRCVFNFTHTINGISVNSLVPDKAATFQLITIIDIAKKVLEIGTCCHLGKQDLKSAFRQSIKHHSQVYEIAYYWRDEILADWYMPWGTRNAARKCHLVSKGIVHVTEKFLPPELHGRILCYIDDFMFFGKSKEECNYLMEIFETVCLMLGYEIKSEKKESASSESIMLGREIICPSLWIKAQDKKIDKYKNKLLDLLKVDFIEQTDLRSIEGSLSNIAPLAWPLKSLLRRFRDVIPYTEDKHQKVLVTPLLKDEAKMWLRLIDKLNGIKLHEILPSFDPKIDEHVFFDASNIGFGAYYEPYWLYAPFHNLEVKSGKKNNIAYRELFCCVAAVNAWAGLWFEKVIQFNTDSTQVYYALLKKDARDKLIMDFVREICLKAVEYKFRFYIQWIPRERNKKADALSKLEINKFKKLCENTCTKCVECPMLFKRPNGCF